MEESKKIEYYGITYPKIFDNRLVKWLWKRINCKKNKHLFDETSSFDEHYLYCDACGLYVGISYVLTEEQMSKKPLPDS